MTPYTLLFFYPSSWRERLICFLGRMKYVHVSVVIGDGSLMTESSFPHGVRTEMRGHFEDMYKYRHDKVTLKGLAPDHFMMRWAFSKRGIKYGTWDCVQTFFRRRLGLKIGGNPGGVECAEHAAHFILFVRTPGLDYIETRFGITPDELYAIVKGIK